MVGLWLVFLPSATLLGSVLCKNATVDLCPRFLVPRHGALDSPALITLGSWVSFRCFHGYILIGPSIVTCQADGSWSGSPPTCQRGLRGARPDANDAELARSFSTQQVAAVQRFQNSWDSDQPLMRDSPMFSRGGPGKRWLQNIVNRLWRDYNKYRHLHRHPRQRRQRREYRQLSRRERKRFHEALHGMMNTAIPGTSPPMSEYHFLVSLHSQQHSPGAHQGPAFPPWHRIFLIIFELVLQSHRPGVTLPYWDSSLDWNLPDSSDSIMFSERFLGTRTGQVTSGDFAFWNATQSCANTDNKGILTREKVKFGRLYEDEHIEKFHSASSYSDFITKTAFEDKHGSVHVWVGGHMDDISCAPNDPIFWMHHAMVDRLWEDFRRKSQTTELDTDYPLLNDKGPYHHPNSTVLPFGPLKNIDGLNDIWSRYVTYNQRPVRCRSNHDCGRYLWCNQGRCMSKVKLGGNCSGLPGRSSPCECGKCSINGTCETSSGYTYSGNACPLV